MLGVYASAAAILLASLVLGGALLHLLGRTEPPGSRGRSDSPRSPSPAPLLIRLPGRATTLAILLAGVGARRGGRWYRRCGAGRGSRPRHGPRACPVAGDRRSCLAPRRRCRLPSTSETGALGEGIYTNDQARAALLDRLAPARRRPGAERRAFGYPTGPQSVAAAAAEATNASLLDAFNGLLLAIPVLTALAALAALERLPAGRRVARRLADRPAVPGRLVPGPERLQGDRDGAPGARLRGRARRAGPAPARRRRQPHPRGRWSWR